MRNGMKRAMRRLQPIIINSLQGDKMVVMHSIFQYFTLRKICSSFGFETRKTCQMIACADPLGRMTIASLSAYYLLLTGLTGLGQADDAGLCRIFIFNFILFVLLLAGNGNTQQRVYSMEPFAHRLYALVCIRGQVICMMMMMMMMIAADLWSVLACVALISWPSVVKRELNQN
ncbi:hypothetical protein GGR50DRAFT_652565 [Xylaria sp. CBS 124048]|nr:hypothetical protein GGR50DRAFT_652565 [Xylaria sp. CBS 124048]